MRVRIVARDSETFAELKYRVTDVWDEEVIALSDDQFAMILQNPPSALEQELKELGYEFAYGERELVNTQ
jgi:hypothetical protein